jgi:RNA 3'-terminal phosphate cyclase (ATP)
MGQGMTMTHSTPHRGQIEIDGATGEGGGQVLRTALALSLVTGTGFRMHSIRANRERPGLQRQHLTAVRAAQAVGRASVTGADVGSREVTFAPVAIVGGEHHFAIGTAGSTTLVLQAVLPALLRASESSRVTLEGGTHNPLAPPFEFLAQTLATELGATGARVRATLERHGFFPAGGGRIVVEVTPADAPRRYERLEPIAGAEIAASAMVAHLHARIARTELDTLAPLLGIAAHALRADEIGACDGPGNAVVVTVDGGTIVETFSSIGQKHVGAAEVANQLAAEVQAYLACGAPVGAHLADQLLAPLTVLAGGSFLTGTPTLHTRTAAEIITRFTGQPITFEPVSPGRCHIHVPAASPARSGGSHE